MTSSLLNPTSKRQPLRAVAHGAAVDSPYCIPQLRAVAALPMPAAGDPGEMLAIGCSERCILPLANQDIVASTASNPDRPFAVGAQDTSFEDLGAQARPPSRDRFLR